MNSAVSQEDEQYRVEFKPLMIGPHVISLQYGGQAVPGSPHTCNVYDASKVRITDTSKNGIIGNDMGFTGKDTRGRSCFLKKSVFNFSTFDIYRMVW